MKIAIGCDHGGYLLKQDILIWLEEHDYDFKDFGCYNTQSVDYPVYAEKVARAVASGECDRGIVICTTGIGVSIAANKVSGVRCALCGDSYRLESDPGEAADFRGLPHHNGCHGSGEEPRTVEPCGLSDHQQHHGEHHHLDDVNQGEHGHGAVRIVAAHHVDDQEADTAEGDD